MRTLTAKGVPIEQVLADAGRFGKRRSRHGAGYLPRDVQPEEAEAVVSSAAVALILIARRLPCAERPLPDPSERPNQVHVRMVSRV